MDRELSAATKQAYKRRRFWQFGVTVALVAAAIFGFRNLITPSMSRSEIRTAVAENGSVVAIFNRYRRGGARARAGHYQHHTGPY